MSRPTTYVLFTIDAEASMKFGNGFWSWCVNGQMPADLDAWLDCGLAVQEPLGIRPDRNRIRELGRIRDLSVPESPGALEPPAEELQQMLDVGPAGLPVIFRSLRRYGLPAVVYLDISGLYTFGAPAYLRSARLTDYAGQDLQMHVHPSVACFDADWFAERGLPPGPVGVEVQDWPRDVAEPFHRYITDEFERLHGRRPIAYRAGAYRISNAIIDSLVATGYRIDSSVDQLNAQGNVGLDLAGWDNAARRYRQIVELPISAYRWRNDRLMRFVVRRWNTPNPQPGLLDGMHRRGVRVISYILHSYSLQRKICIDDDPARKWGWGKADPELVETFEQTLEYVASHPGLEVVNSAGLLRRIEGDPAILSGAGVVLSASP